MKKIVDYKKAKVSAMALTLATAMTLTGCSYTGDIFTDLGSLVKEISEYSNGEDAEIVSIPKSIDPIEFYEEIVEEEKVSNYKTEKVEKKELKTSLDTLDNIYAYLTYTTNDKYVFYSVDFLIPVITEDYVAYYKALDGTLEKVEIPIGSRVKKSKYKSYIEKGIIELGCAKDEIYNPNYAEFVINGIDLENNTITRKSYVYMELGYLNKNQDEVSKIIDDLYKEKGLN